MRELTYATVCSGIECMSAACLDLPMRPVFFSEIEPFPCAVLRHRFPNVPNLGDMSKIHINGKGEITNGIANVPLPAGGLDVLAGGTPCQDVSNAGKRRGMAEGSGTRSSLAFEFVRLIRELRPRYVVWENVAGVLTDESFPQFLRAVADCGYGVAYRTLDAQYVRCADIDLPDGGVVRLERAVPQRRRRVWAVGCAGADVGKASEVLFEPPGVCGDRPPRRVAGQGPARALVGRARVPDGVVGGAAAIASNVIGRSDGCGGNGGGVKALNGGVAGTVVNGTCPRSHNAVCYENHQTDARVRDAEASPTLGSTHNAQAANNNPLVVETFVVTNSNGGVVMPAISAMEYKQVESQKDKGGGYVLERREPLGFKCNPSEKTRGIGAEREVAPCLSSSCDASVAFVVRQGKPGGGNGALLSEERALCVGAGAEQSVILTDVASMRYVVRRLTPTECERLMGLPDGWTLPAFQPVEITDRLDDEFRRIHDTFGAVMAGYAGKPPPKPKTAAWVHKWLERIANPETCPDAPRYKACGNGWATNQPRWILLRLLHAENVNPWEE